MCQPGVSGLTRLRMYDWAVTHRGRRWPSPAQHSASPPALCRKLLHPQLAQHQGTKSASSSSTAHTLALQLTPLELCTTLHSKAAEGQHMLMSTVPVVFGPEQGARALFGPEPAAMHQHQLQPRVGQAGRTCVQSDLTESSSKFSDLLFGSRSTEGYQWVASYPKYTLQGK